MEYKIVKLQEDLKQARDKMVSSELLKEQAEFEAEDAKKQLSEMTIKMKDMEKNLIGISGNDQSLIQELHKMSQDNDTLLETDLEVSQKQNSLDSAVLINSSDLAFDEFLRLQTEHYKAVAMVEKLKIELAECKKSEAQMLQKLMKTRTEMDAVSKESKTLTFEASELKESKAKVNALEILVSKLQSKLVSCGDGHNEEMEQLKSEIMNLKYQDCKLKAALEAAEMRYQEVSLQSTLEIRNAYEQTENTNLILRSKEAELQKSNSDITELQVKLADHEKKSQTSAEKDQKTQLEISITALQETLLQKETLLQEIHKENESLKQRLTTLVNRSCADNATEARSAEQKDITKLENPTEEDKNIKKTARVIEQLNAAQAVNTELESELRKLKVQSDQWRKAAEAAAAMLTSGNNGKYIDRTGSLDSGYHTLGGRINSPYAEDLNDDSVKKKNGNMLKKIGVLWKKGQNQK